MVWSWQKRQWPQFEYDVEMLKAQEDRFLLEAGKLLGAFSHFDDDDKQKLTIDLVCNEALKSSAIEGEILNRGSLQSSIRRHFGLTTEVQRVPPAEQGMAAMMVDLYQHFAQPLSHEVLFHWHENLMLGRRDLYDVARYRTGEEPMQVVSGSIYQPKIHFEAPPSSRLTDEMATFIGWFNRTAPEGQSPLPALTRAGLAHLYFVTIHPFEDGNGRIARGLSQKVLAQSIKRPTLIALSHMIEKRKKDYYTQLNKHNHTLAITPWLRYFATTVLESVAYSQSMISFLIGKASLFNRLHGKLNPRQEKVLARMFREGLEGFKGGLSAENYITITGTSRATATRDLQKLVALGALAKTGTLKSTRYWLTVLEDLHDTNNH